MKHVDVLIVGAGISGIGAAYHLKTLSPDRSFVILEGRENLGGTWDLFRYPGVRSDSDMHTLGYSFKPWTAEKAIADGPSILSYLHETASEFGINEHIRFRHLATKAEWSSEEAVWTVHATHAGESVRYTCNYLFMCSGYYSYKGGHSPHFEGRGDFKGLVVHPQEWPTDLDYKDKRVVIIGSGATAVTLVPAMAPDAKSVTMLQRSPTYVVSAPAKDPVANALRKVLPDGVAYKLTRWKNVTLGAWFYKRTRTHPAQMKSRLLKMVRKELGPDYDVDTHFTPTYNPWDQRLCLVPDSDLFKAIRSGSADVVTNKIDRFTESGILLATGEELEADIIVTATGLSVVTLGEMEVFNDGEQIDFSQTVSYKGFAYSDVPNLATCFGYVNASWTLRADLVAEAVCRLLNHMAVTRTQVCTPRLRASDADMTLAPWVNDFSAGYLQRVMSRLPTQGDREPWLNTQNYAADKKLFRNGQVEDGVMQFTKTKISV